VHRGPIIYGLGASGLKGPESAYLSFSHIRRTEQLLVLIAFVIYFTAHLMSNMKLGAEFVCVPLRKINRRLNVNSVK
jgi:hypothetical protein